MGKRIHHLREVSEAEDMELRALASSRPQPYRMVQRVKLIVSMLDDETLTASQAVKQVGFKAGVSGACWVKRFNEAGPKGLVDIVESIITCTHL